MSKQAIWFRQDRRWHRLYPVHPMGWISGLAFLAAFFGITLLFLVFDPFRPEPNLPLLGLWWLSILVLMLGFHLFARRFTQKLWRRPHAD